MMAANGNWGDWRSSSRKKSEAWHGQLKPVLKRGNKSYVETESSENWSNWGRGGRGGKPINNQCNTS